MLELPIAACRKKEYCAMCLFKIKYLLIKNLVANASLFYFYYYFTDRY
jgi:hypothetical protein